MLVFSPHIELLPRIVTSPYSDEVPEDALVYDADSQPLTESGQYLIADPDVE